MAELNLEVGGKGSGADLARGTVGQAGLIVSGQVKISRTGTFMFPAGGQKTQVAASSVRNLTLVFGYCTEGAEEQTGVHYMNHFHHNTIKEAHHNCSA